MACEVSDELIEMYGLGNLPEAEPELLDHLRICPECVKRVADGKAWAEHVDRAFKDSGR